MKFCLVDRIVEFVPAKTITTAKNVSLAEEYLLDHFPGFPVLPGVLMLEAGVQAAAWLVREWCHFSSSLVVLKEARGIRYGAFVEPGRTLIMRAEVILLEETRSEFKIRGSVGDGLAITGRIELAHLRLSRNDPSLDRLDQVVVESLSAQWRQLRTPVPEAI